MLRVAKEFQFHAAHHLPFHKGKCARVHGHTYRLQVVCEGQLRDDGLVIDFEEIKEIVEREVIEKLDHRDLNDVIENPSAEMVVLWIWERIHGFFEKKNVRLKKLVLWESPSAFVEYSE